MRFIGLLFFGLIGLFFFRLSLSNYRQNSMDYSKYPVKRVKYFGKPRWDESGLVSLVDETGEEVWGREIFSSRKERNVYSEEERKKYGITRPIVDQYYDAYCWKTKSNSKHNGKRVCYDFVFCEPSFYKDLQKDAQRTDMFGMAFGILFIAIGIMIFMLS